MERMRNRAEETYWRREGEEGNGINKERQAGGREKRQRRRGGATSWQKALTRMI